jgi:hypothetical protein
MTPDPWYVNTNPAPEVREHQGAFAASWEAFLERNQGKYATVQDAYTAFLTESSLAVNDVFEPGARLDPLVTPKSPTEFTPQSFGTPIGAYNEPFAPTKPVVPNEQVKKAIPNELASVGQLPEALTKKLLVHAGYMLHPAIGIGLHAAVNAPRDEDDERSILDKPISELLRPVFDYLKLDKPKSIDTKDAVPEAAPAPDLNYQSIAGGYQPTAPGSQLDRLYNPNPGAAFEPASPFMDVRDVVNSGALHQQDDRITFSPIHHTPMVDVATGTGIASAMDTTYRTPSQPYALRDAVTHKFIRQLKPEEHSPTHDFYAAHQSFFDPNVVNALPPPLTDRAQTALDRYNQFEEGGTSFEKAATAFRYLNIPEKTALLGNLKPEQRDVLLKNQDPYQYRISPASLEKVMETVNNPPPAINPQEAIEALQPKLTDFNVPNIDNAEAVKANTSAIDDATASLLTFNDALGSAIEGINPGLPDPTSVNTAGAGNGGSGNIPPPGNNNGGAAPVPPGGNNPRNVLQSIGTVAGLTVGQAAIAASVALAVGGVLNTLTNVHSKATEAIGDFATKDARKESALGLGAAYYKGTAEMAESIPILGSLVGVLGLNAPAKIMSAQLQMLESIDKHAAQMVDTLAPFSSAVLSSSVNSQMKFLEEDIRRGKSIGGSVARLQDVRTDYQISLQRTQDRLLQLMEPSIIIVTKTLTAILSILDKTFKAGHDMITGTGASGKFLFALVQSIPFVGQSATVLRLLRQIADYLAPENKVDTSSVDSFLDPTDTMYGSTGSSWNNAKKARKKMP